MAGLPAAIGIHLLIPLCGSPHILPQNPHDAGRKVLPHQPSVSILL
jgi:hypothetical protein